MNRKETLEQLKKEVAEQKKENHELEEVSKTLEVLSALKSNRKIDSLNKNIDQVKEILERIEQKEFPQPKDFPKEIKVSNIPEPVREVEVKNLGQIVFPNKFKVSNLNEIKLPESMEFKEPKWLFGKLFDFFEKKFNELKIKVADGRESNLDKYTKKANPLAVKLVSLDGRFYNAGGGGGMGNLGNPTPKFAFVNVAASSTDTNLVSAVSGKSIRVLIFRIHAGGTSTNITFNSKPSGAGYAISELFSVAANGGHHGAYSPIGHFETRPGEGLTVTTGSGSTVGIGIVYTEI